MNFVDAALVSIRDFKYILKIVLTSILKTVVYVSDNRRQVNTTFQREQHLQICTLRGPNSHVNTQEHNTFCALTAAPANPLGPCSPWVRTSKHYKELVHLRNYLNANLHIYLKIVYMQTDFLRDYNNFSFTCIPGRPIPEGPASP